MKFGIFYEHQLPRPWNEGDEHRLFQEALDQVELADRLGIDYAWEVEHHFLEEYSHSSAPEIFLAACSQRTRRIRLGHGICLMPPKYNHPARVAERIATLDLVSNGRVEFGTGESASLMELGGFNVRFDPVEKRRMWKEGVEQCTDMMVMDPYPGFKGEFFEMPCRNVVPKPLQKPHPPLWVACSNRETIKMAARCGIGALTFAFVDPREARQWVDDYYRIFKEECVPIGHAVNPNVAMVTGFSVHPDEMESRRRGEDGLRFFRYGLAHHYIFGEHKPGRTDIWANFEKARHALPPAGADHGIGTPDQLRGARTVRQRCDAGIQGTRNRAGKAEAGRARALHRKGDGAQTGDKTDARRGYPDFHRARPKSGRRRHRHRAPEAERQTLGRCRQGDLERPRAPRHQSFRKVVNFAPHIRE
jgi:alkanesulfonate monooxygenase SsuD/methylene tetrahydromethanopterin reductase-like flavin-dependent oxidoreductase (luciferase family)